MSEALPGIGRKLNREPLILGLILNFRDVDLGLDLFNNFQPNWLSEVSPTTLS